MKNRSHIVICGLGAMIGFVLVSSFMLLCMDHRNKYFFVNADVENYRWAYTMNYNNEIDYWAHTYGKDMLKLNLQ